MIKLYLTMLHITLRQLKVFESVARLLNFTRAAEELHLTQPAVSIQIKQLETMVALPLFEQMGKRIYLTEAGQELFNERRLVELRINRTHRFIEFGDRVHFALLANADAGAFAVGFDHQRES